MDETELGLIVVEYGPDHPLGIAVSAVLDSREEAESIISRCCSVNEQLGFEGYTYRIFTLEAKRGEKD